MTTGSVINIWH